MERVELPEAYERLLLDAQRGDATLFMRSEDLEAAWEFITPMRAMKAGRWPVCQELFVRCHRSDQRV